MNVSFANDDKLMETLLSPENNVDEGEPTEDPKDMLDVDGNDENPSLRRERLSEKGIDGNGCVCLFKPLEVSVGPGESNNEKRSSTAGGCGTCACTWFMTFLACVSLA